MTANPIKFISAGFSVGKLHTKAASYTCNGQKDETVCVWYSAAHTKYQAQNMIANYCDSGWYKDTHGDPFYFTSPNTGGKHSDYYCVVGSCRDKGQGYWNTDGRVGCPDGVDDLGEKGVSPCAAANAAGSLLGVPAGDMCK